ncbi:MAG: MHS family MFS transporter [Candidatus Protistobacter heckmanni]|nr:MHS family MFS transporter [Candidatus Protistobacter heckmanni]
MSNAYAGPASVASAETPTMRSVVFASAIGTIIEWYDFLIYGTAAALVFNKLFFPNVDPFVGTLAAFGSYAVGFLARPLGGALFGHFGDRVGRKSMLMLIMGLGTALIGCLPTYETVGVWAPIMLITLRLVQGIGLGGEWGGASLLVLEHAPHGKRGFYGSLVQIGFPLGLVLSSLAFVTASKMPEADFLAWGWRLPFLLSVVLVGLGMFIRTRVQESPVFEQMKAQKRLAERPVFDAVFKHPGAFLSAIGLKLSEVSWVYILTVFVVFYATTKLGLPKKLILDGILYAALLELVTLPFFGWLSDQIGRKPMYVIGATISILMAYPMFMLLETKDPAIITATIVVAMSLGHGMMFAPESTYFPELFGANVRYSGASFGFQVSAALGGGLGPIIATALTGYMGGTSGVTALLIGVAVITLIAALKARETKNDPLQH